MSDILTMTREEAMVEIAHRRKMLVDSTLTLVEHVTPKSPIITKLKIILEELKFLEQKLKDTPGDEEAFSKLGEVGKWFVEIWEPYKRKTFK